MARSNGELRSHPDIVRERSGAPQARGATMWCGRATGAPPILGLKLHLMGVSIQHGRLHPYSTSRSKEVGLTEVGQRELETDPDHQKGLQAWLYDVTGDDAPIRISDVDLADLNDQQIIWVDVDLRTATDVDSVLRDLGIGDLVTELDTSFRRPSLIAQENLVQLNVFAAQEHPTDFVPVALHCLVGKNWIATLHGAELNLVEEFNAPLANHTRLGGLDSSAFLAVVLDWHLNSYLRAIEAVQAAIDEVDELLLKPRADEPHLLERLFQLRRRVTKLRSALSPHRDVFGPPSNPHSEVLASAAAAPDFHRLSQRLEHALEEVTTSRDMIAVSFEIYMTQVAQNTNDIMKRLTLASVLLLPAVLLAGIMGMNFQVPLFDEPSMFWVTVFAMGFLAICTLAFARSRKWL
ncbi:MAG: magnesium transporter CorA family protein [Acidimicrobiia bacterium]